MASRFKRMLGVIAAGSDPFVASGLSVFTSAMRQTRAGVSDTRIMLLGDSTTASFGAGATDGWAPNGYSSSLSVLLAQSFNNAGICYASADAFIGNMNQTYVQKPTSDNRFNFNGSTTWSTTSESLGTAHWMSAGTDRMDYSPAATCDTLDVRTMIRNGTSVPNAGIIAVYMDDTTLLGTINNKTAGSDTYTTTTFTFAAGVHKFSFVKQSGVNAYVHSAYPRLSSRKELSILVGARPSGTADTIALETFPWSGLNAMRTFQPHLTIICIGLNDVPALTAQATVESALTRSVAAARETGDALLVIPNSRNSPANETTIFGYIQNVATAQSVPLIDRRTAIGTYSQAVAANLMYDTTHPNAAGYALINAQQFARITT